MQCPVCGQQMTDVTDSWDTFTEADGAEYLADYVTIWHCPACSTVAGTDNQTVEWVMEPEGVAVEEQ